MGTTQEKGMFVPKPRSGLQLDGFNGGGLGSARLKVGPDFLRGLFQLK